MDAKAKVVAYLVTEPATAISLKSSYAYTLEECDNAVNPDHEPLVTLTDHEAALAELAERHAATERNACLMAELANEEKRKRQELLTGLEALAGEWEIRGLELESVGESEADFINAAALTSAANRLRRTLTNSAKGGA